MTLKDELLSQGIQAYQAGDLASAAAIFTQLVKQLPDEDQGWLWLGKTLPSPERKQFCFQRAIQLNPANAEAGHLLVQLSRPDRQPPVSTPTQQASPGSPIPAARPFVPAQQPAVPPSAPPFLMEAQRPEPVPEQAHATSAVETAANPPPATAIPVQKAPRSRLLPTIGLVVGLGICVLGVFLIVSMDLLSDLGALLPLSPLPTQALLPTSLPATAGQPTRTATISPVPQASPTPSLAARLPTVAYTPAYRSVPCTFDAPTGVVVNCGRLTVPEDRTDPDSDSIELAVAVFRSTAADPEPDPVLFLQGGPGGEAVMLSANAFSILVEPFLAARDFIAVDQRGTGLSEPALGCEELTDVYQQDIHGQIPASSRGFIFENAFRSCHGMMAISGIDLSAYTTYESAADLRDLVAALGYTQVNLYGASYGTRLAQVLMREHPAVVRSAILDSVVPLDISLYATDEVRFTNALNQLFTVCRNDQACNRDYPGLETVFWDLVAALNTEPVTVTAPLLTGGEITEDLAGTDLLNITLAMLKQTDLIASVPQSIYRIQAGDYSTFVAAQSSLPFAFEGIDIGLYISMMCHEHILTSTVTELQAAFDGAMDLGLYSRLPFLGEAADLFDTCELWGAEAPRVGENDPLVSDIPSLVIEGAFDPTTPPLFGQRILPGLSRATYVEFPNQGHVPTAMDASGCAMEIVQDFLAAPGQTPDSDCVEDSLEVGFVLPYKGTPAEVLTGYAGDGFRASRPAGWHEIWDGIFLRDNSPLDITQIVLMRTYGTSEELLDSLSSKLYGYQGFDAAPLQTGTRQENGLSWSLYRTSSYGRPVELAMADDQGSAIIILLFCHVDEREALVETVFLPMIDSVVPEP